MHERVYGAIKELHSKLVAAPATLSLFMVPSELCGALFLQLGLGLGMWGVLLLERGRARAVWNALPINCPFRTLNHETLSRTLNDILAGDN